MSFLLGKKAKKKDSKKKKGGDKIQDTSDLRQRCEVAVMPLYAGKSKLQAALAQYQGTPRLVCFDADSIADAVVRSNPELQAYETTANSAMLESELFPLLQGKLAKFLETNPNDVVICVTSNTKWVDWLQMKHKRITLFLPCAALYAQMVKDLAAANAPDTTVPTLFQKSRDDQLMWSAKLECEPKFNVYNSMDDIVRVIAVKFDLKLSAI